MKMRERRFQSQFDIEIRKRGWRGKEEEEGRTGRRRGNSSSISEATGIMMIEPLDTVPYSVIQNVRLVHKEHIYFILNHSLSISACAAENLVRTASSP